jgi:hypothetical protein
VTRKLGDQDLVLKFHGKVEGDSIKGKVDFDYSGQTGSGDFAAKREKVAKK